MNYYRFQVEGQSCKHCGWKGAGAETARGETFESLFEFHCPNCEVKLGICTYPTRKDAEEAWDLVPDADRKQFELRRRYLEACERHELKRADQLPPIDSSSFALVWDDEEQDGWPRTWAVIRLGDRVIWREPAQYEGGDRFAEIAAILKERYGAALTDLEPTRASFDFLYGDSWRMPDVVAAARACLSTAPPASTP